MLIFAKLIQLSLLSVNWIVKVFFVNVEEFVNDEFSQRNVFTKVEPSLYEIYLSCLNCVKCKNKALILNTYIIKYSDIIKINICYLFVSFVVDLGTK